MQIHVIERLEKLFPGFLAETDLFAGTSDGAIMSLFLAARLSDGQAGPDALAACRAFADKYAAALGTDMLGVLRFVPGLRPLTDGVAFHDTLATEFGSRTLGDLDRKVAIVSFDTARWTPRVYRNFGVVSAHDRKLTLLDVALSSSSLPLAMPIHGGHDESGYLDGVVAANNPTMTGVALAVRELIRPNIEAGQDPLQHITALSFGVSQTAEEANLERLGGPLRTLVMLFSEDRELRFWFLQRSWRDRLRYLRSAEFRKKAMRTEDFRGVGSANWGWLAMLNRPTLLATLLIHGLDGEVDEQARNLLGPDRYFRYSLRISLARAILNLALFRGRLIDDDAANRAFATGDDPELSHDEIYNRRRTRDVCAWIPNRWFDEAPPVASLAQAVKGRG